jgi:hypothetical protein
MGELESLTIRPGDNFRCGDTDYTCTEILGEPREGAKRGPLVLLATSARRNPSLVKSFAMAGVVDPEGARDNLEKTLVRQRLDRLGQRDRDCIVTIEGVGLFKTRLLIARKYVSDAGIAAALSGIAGGDRPQSEVFWNMLRRLAELLDSLNGLEIIHGHVCPGNIFVGGDGGVTLTDLGLAWDIARHDPYCREQFLRDVAVAPGSRELLRSGGRGGGPDERIDQYGLAYTYGYLRLGRPLTEAEIGGSERPPLPREEYLALQKGLDPEPGRRWKNCIGLIRGLQDALERTPPPPPPSPSKRTLPYMINLLQLRSYAEAVRDALPSPGQEVPSECEPAIADARRLAELTIRTSLSPVRIGVVGGFDAGKSSLLAALIGRTDVLPALARPTTGNITALRLRAEPGLEATEVGQSAIEWMDQVTALGCLRALLKEAEARSRTLPEVDQQERAGLAGEAEEGRADWKRIEKWCRQSWDRSGQPPNPDFRYVLRELTWFARCCASPAGAALLARTDRQSVLPGGVSVHEGLTLPPAAEVTEIAFERLPAGPVVLEVPEPSRPEFLDFLRTALPLIRRVQIEVALPPRLWDMTSRPDSQPLILLDFPGLGAAQSSVRDAFLCEEELREVQTILIVLDGSSLGSAEGTSLFTRLQATRQDLRDNILVAINRFDDVKGGPPPEGQAVREDDLEGTAPTLHAIRIAASILTPSPDRWVLACALYALDRLSEDFPVGEGSFRNDWARAEQRWSTIDSRRWRQVADQLRAVDSPSVLASQLDAVVSDGGLLRLRTLLEEHVAEYGLPQLFERVHQFALQLRSVYESLPKRNRTGQYAHRPSVQALREQVRALQREYQAMRDEYRERPPELAIREQDEEVTLLDSVVDSVEGAIWGLEVWNDLLVDIQDGLLPRVDPDVIFGDFIEPPGDSRVFFQDFEQRLKDCWDSIDVKLERAIQHLLSGLATRINEKTPGLSPALDASAEQRAGRLPGSPGRVFQALRRAADPTGPGVRDPFIKRLRDEQFPFEPNRWYPLAGAAGPDDTAQRLDWSRDSDRPELCNDQAIVARLRNQLVRGARAPLVARVQRLNQIVSNGLDSFFKQCAKDLDRVLDQPGLLQSIAGEAQPGQSWAAGKVKWPFPDPEA